MADFDQDAIVAILGEAGGAPRAAVDAIQYYGLASLLNGTARTMAEIASLSDLDVADIETGVRALVEVGRIDRDEDRVIGVGGLTLAPTVHSLRRTPGCTHGAHSMRSAFLQRWD